MAGDLVDTVYGFMPAWLACSPLGELCVPDEGVQTGPFGSQLHARDYVDHGTPIITVQHLGENRIVHQEVPCVSDEDRRRLARFELLSGDIVFSRVGSVDRRALVRRDEEGWLFSGRCLRVRPDPRKIDPAFLSWFFGYSGFQAHIRRIAVGATMPSLNTRILREVPIFYPPELLEQQAIAHILAALDDKIALNRRLSETLEETARALFKSWFVDYDPVRAKAAGRQPAGLAPEVAALFPDALEDSALGPIPKGWRVCQIADLSAHLRESVNPGQSPDELFSHFSLPAFDGGATPAREQGSSIKSGKFSVPPGAVLVSRLNPRIERVWLVDVAPGERAVCSTEFMVLVPRAPVERSYLYCLARSVSFTRRLLATATGTSGSHQRAPVAAVMSMRICRPPDDTLGAFATSCSGLLSRALRSRREQGTLAELRDALLPRLISGALRVPDAERIVARAV